MPDHRYNIDGISPKQFLLFVMWDETVEITNRIRAADALTQWVQAGDFREPDLGYVIQEPVLQ